MKTLRLLVMKAMLMTSVFTIASPDNTNTAGFALPDSLQEMTLKFKSYDNLIILPVLLNDSNEVNLILDTGCRNLVLFGKKFEKILKVQREKPVIFSGLGNGAPVKGHLSINNSVSIESVIGKLVPIVVVPEKNLFSQYPNVHGVIGYDIFFKFEIEINSRANTITFRKALTAEPPLAFATVPLKVIDSRPVMQTQFSVYNKSTKSDLMIDTGSSIGLLLKTTDLDSYNSDDIQRVIGRGLNGDLYGFKTIIEQLSVNDFNFSDVDTGIISSPWHNHASIGMGVLKDYIVILNYCKQYACFKKLG